MLLRLLFPSWAFFDAVTEVPALEVRTCTNGQWGEWRPAMAAPRRTMWSLLYHPRGTLHLAEQSVVDRLAMECEQGVVDPLSAELVARIAARAHGGFAVGASTVWSWRVVARTMRDPDGASRVLYEAGVASGSV